MTQTKTLLITLTFRPLSVAFIRTSSDYHSSSGSWHGWKWLCE